ncbi:MAG TPA: class I SAM-dependent methyltransferase [Gemmatimonadaceae bacterium]|nr:class I SAM-dependent methyltransferase [Gemmatimonadaceae bacterium]
MSGLAPARGYALWAPTYAAETAVSALEASVVESFGVPLAGRRVLDVGCGIARRLRPAREAGATVVAGVDLTPAMLARAHDEPLLAAADVRALPVVDGAFDVVWCRLVLGHVSTLEAAYAELARVCAPHAHVVVTDFHPAAAAAGHRRTFRDAQGVLHELEHHAHPQQAHRAAAERAGFALRDCRDAVVGEPVRGFYERADRLDAYERQLGLPIVLAMLFVRHP